MPIFLFIILNNGQKTFNQKLRKEIERKNLLWQEIIVFNY